MHQIVSATYQEGVLKLAHRLSLAEQQRVMVIVLPLPAATAQSDPARLARLKEQTATWLSQQPSDAIKPPLSLQPDEQQALDNDFDAVLREIHARSSRLTEAEIAADVETALIEVWTLAPDAAPEVKAELSAILAKWA